MHVNETVGRCSPCKDHKPDTSNVLSFFSSSATRWPRILARDTTSMKSGRLWSSKGSTSSIPEPGGTRARYLWEKGALLFPFPSSSCICTANSLRSWRDSCVRGTFLAAKPPSEASDEAARDFKLTCIPTLLEAPPPKTILHFHANPVSYARHRLICSPLTLVYPKPVNIAYRAPWLAGSVLNIRW